MNREAYDLGYDAYWDGVEASENPFDAEEDDEKAKSWTEGWQKAQFDDFDESD